MKLRWKQLRTYRHTAEFVSSALSDTQFLLEISYIKNLWTITIELEAWDNPELLIMTKNITLGQKYSTTVKREAEEMLAEWLGYMVKDDEKFKALEDK